MQFWDNNNDEERDGGNSNRPPPRPPNWRKWVSPGLLVLVMLLALVSSPGLFGGYTATPEIAYSDFYEQLRAHNVKTIDFQDTTSLIGQLRSSIFVTTPSGRQQTVTRFTANIPIYAGPEVDRLARESAVERIDQTYSTNSPWPGIILQFLPLVFIIGFFVWMGRRAQGQMNGIFSFGQSQARGKNTRNAGDPI